MEKKIKHRILGALVMIALAIILLPFFQNGKGLSIERVSVKAPPFPSETIQTVNLDTAVNPQDQASQDVVQPTDDLMSVNRPSVINVKTPEVGQTEKQDTNKTPAVEIPTTVNKSKAVELESIFTNKDASHVGKVVQAFKRNRNSKILASKTKLDKDNLFSLKKPAWVIQIGSFKNKENALRLANQLRANGYNAFIQRVTTAFGENTRVFIGPESKLISAHALASQLESDMHIHGIVISYKPLTL